MGKVALWRFGYGLYCLINAGFRETRIDGAGTRQRHA